MSSTEQVARWLHETFIAKCKKRLQSLEGLWKEQPTIVKNQYRAIAAELLTNPPKALVKALAKKKAVQ